MVPLVKDNNPLDTKKTISLHFVEVYAREGRPGVIKICSLLTDRPRRYISEIMPIRREIIELLLFVRGGVNLGHHLKGRWI